MVPLSNKVLWFYIIVQKKKYDLKPNEKPESYPSIFLHMISFTSHTSFCLAYL